MTELAEAKVKNILGMAQRARRIASGAFAVEQAMRGKKAAFLLIAADAEDESKRKYRKIAAECGVPHAEALTRESLGGCIGKEYRAAAALLDEGFARKLQGLLAIDEAKE